jgi:serine/threonine-protein kinase HipA
MGMGRAHKQVMTDARVILWGRDIGAVSWLDDRGIGVFQYTPEFAKGGIEVAPVRMPLTDAPYQFPDLSRGSFLGLPGLLADSLPDKFGHALINAWLAQQDRSPESFNPVERLSYIGNRGTGALEFKPTIRGPSNRDRQIEVAALVDLANRVLDERVGLEGKFNGEDDARAIEDILRVGTSAGGARAKAILAWNEETGAFRSGQANSGEGYTHWLMKFDGIHGNRDKELADPQGFGRIEYAYHLMATQAGIKMMRCRLHEEGGRAHFMTKRFDRTDTGDKLHMQSLGAMMHYDFNQAGAYSYEQAILTIRQLRLPIDDVEQQIRRAIFNVMARNQDDHVKNIAFLMNRHGEWRLSPAFDLAYSYNPTGQWTSRHQMSLSGKRDNFQRNDLVELARVGGIKPAKAGRLIDQVAGAIRDWDVHALAAGVRPEHVENIANAFRIDDTVIR